MKERYFLVGKEWNVVHLPSRPNGFAIFVIGDQNHFIHDQASSWDQRPDQYHFIQKLKDEGYTVISSNLHGRNWGSDEACELLQRVKDEVIKREILNKKVHIVAVGMGALVAAKLIPNKKELFRSVILIDPCLSLRNYVEVEKENKLFYKRIIKEIKQAYKLEENQLEQVIADMDFNYNKGIPIPIKIFHTIEKNSYSLQQHIRPYEKMCRDAKIDIGVSILLKAKGFEQFAKPTIEFFKKAEKDL